MMGSRASRIAVGLMIATLFMGSTVLTPLYELYRVTYGLSAVTLVLLYAVYVLGNLCALLVFGRLSDQLGRRPMVLAGLVLAGLSAALFARAHQLSSLFVARTINGLAVGSSAGATTAWLTEFTAPEKRGRAATMMTTFNFLGLSAGAVISGVLVQYAPDPLQLPFLAYGVLLVTAALLACRTGETVTSSAACPGPLLRPRLGVPAGMRLAFGGPAIAGFVANALAGLYAALGPTLVKHAFHFRNVALGACQVAAFFFVAALTIAATRNARAVSTVRAGLTLTPLALVLMVAAQTSGSIQLLVIATTTCGAAVALTYRGSLARIAEIAPSEQKAATVSAYFVCCFLGNALPVIGVGAMTRNHGLAFSIQVFSATLTALALIALSMSGRRFGR